VHVDDEGAQAVHPRLGCGNLQVVGVFEAVIACRCLVRLQEGFVVCPPGV
jgi:hypothetical protein